MTTKTEFLPMDYKTHLFDEIKDKVHFYKCRLCSKEIKCAKGTGYTNLKTHAIGHDNVNPTATFAQKLTRKKKGNVKKTKIS